jgi:hypothetical protein
MEAGPNRGGGWRGNRLGERLDPLLGGIVVIPWSRDALPEQLRKVGTLKDVREAVGDAHGEELEVVAGGTAPSREAYRPGKNPPCPGPVRLGRRAPA